ncbi:hypothetical protein [Rhodococcus sp. NPDC060176]
MVAAPTWLVVVAMIPILLALLTMLALPRQLIQSFIDGAFENVELSDR